MPNFQDLEPATDDSQVTIYEDISHPRPQPPRPADEVLAEITRLTHLDDYPILEGVVSPIEEARHVVIGIFPDNILSKISDLVKAYDLLHTEFELRSTSITMFVQEKNRPRVARLVEVNEDEWGNVENLIPLCRQGSEASLMEAEDEIEQLLQTFEVDAEIREFDVDVVFGFSADCDVAVWLKDEVKSSTHGILGWKLQHLHFVYALALISSVTNHVVDFNWQIWEEPVHCFRFNGVLTFRRHAIGSMGEFLGPVWILANDAIIDSVHHSTASSEYLPRTNHSFGQRGFGERGTVLLAGDFAERNQESDRTTSSRTETGTYPMKAPAAHSGNAAGSDFAFNISISVVKLWALWYVNVKFVEQVRDLVDGANAETKTPPNGSRPRIESLEVGSGVVLPVDDSLNEQFVTDGTDEIVCRWYNLDRNDHGNAKTMADIVIEGNTEDVSFYDSYTLLIV